MPFWKKSEDPWDMEPEKRRTWTAGEPQPPAADGEAWKVPGEKETAEEQTPSAMTCPWCGQEMEVGTITGGRDSVQWWPGWPNRFFGASGPEIDILHEGSLFNRYKTAWLCRGCRRMVMEIPEEEIPKPLTSEKAAEQLEEQRRREAQRKIDRGLQG